MQKLIAHYTFIIIPIIVWGYSMPATCQNNTFEKTYGLYSYNEGVSILQTTDKGYVMLANRTGFLGNSDIYLAKVNFLGQLEWERNFGSPANDIATDLLVLQDNNFLITAYTNRNSTSSYDVLAIKTDAAGNILWEKTWGGTDWDIAQAATESTDTTYIITGYTYSFHSMNEDVFALFLDSQGDTLFSKVYKRNGEEIPYSIKAIANNQFIIGGSAVKADSADMQAFLLKINANGDTLFYKTYGTSSDDAFYDIALTPDHAFYYAAGITFNPGGITSDAYVMKIDSMGTTQWANQWGDAENEAFSAVNLDDELTLTAVGYTNSFGQGEYDVYAFQTDAGGSLYGNTFGSEDNDKGADIMQTDDKGFIIIGYTEGNGPHNTDIYLIKTDSLLDADTSVSHISAVYEKDSEAEIMLFPNPAAAGKETYLFLPEKNPTTETSIRIFSADMQELHLPVRKNDSGYTLLLNAFPSGMYFVRVTLDDAYAYKKLIIR